MTKKTIHQKRVGRDNRDKSYIKRETTTTTSKDNANAVVAALKRIQANADADKISPYEELATDILIEAGLEPTWLGETAIAVKNKVHEPEWYAVKLLEYAWRAREAIKTGKAEWALECGLALATTYSHMYVHSIEAASRAGERQIRSGKNSRKYTESNKEQWVCLAVEMREKNPRLSVNALARNIHEKTGQGYKSIRKHLQDHLKK